MALKRLPNDVQSMLCASTQVNSYKIAIEELVYNSLDADSTSIAIRINIQEKTIQVIDNGFGISKHDFNILGKRYMTSKLTDLSTLKAVPKKYGYRGEYLANIITVSEIVKITSRHENTEETWAKTFQNGKEKTFSKMSTRPTKGTTVDIKGFLYNLNIQNRGIDPVSELQNTKAFLEQLSLVHNNISLSLRDDSKNEIMFKIHKKRDIYQTLSTLFDIDKVDVLELQVEKNEYKVKGFIGNMNKELDLYWMFLNGKFMNSYSKLQKIVNEYFKNYLHIKDTKKLKSKQNDDENQLFNQCIPFYFIFITCPYIDFDISVIPKQSGVQSKNWEQLNKLLEKLVKFYAGDINIKEIKKPQNRAITTEQNKPLNQKTREQVEKIMNKILGNHSKKLGVSQLQNGVKGKKIKRKSKKKTGKLTTNILNFNQENVDRNTHSKRIVSENKSEQPFSNKPNIQILSKEINTAEDTDLRISNTTNKQNDPLHSKKCKLSKKVMTNMKLGLKSKIPTNIKVHKNPNEQKNIINKHNKNITVRKDYCKMLKGLPETNLNKLNNIIRVRKDNYKVMKDLPETNLNKHNKTIKVRKDDCKMMKILPETNSICKLSRIVAQKAEKFLLDTAKRKVNEKKNIDKNVKRNMYVAKLCGDSFENNVLMPRKINKYIVDKFILEKLKKKYFKTTYDLVQTILRSQLEDKNDNINKISADIYSELSDFSYRRNEIAHCLFKIPRTTRWTNKQCFKKYTEIDGQQKEITHTMTSTSIQYKTYKCKDNVDEYSDRYFSKIPENTVSSKDLYNENEYIFRQKEISDYTLSGLIGSKLTYESHQYQKNEDCVQNKSKNLYTFNKKQNIRFITKQSKDNFLTSIDHKYNFRGLPKKTLNKRRQISYDIRMQQTTDESFTIDYSKSNENHQNKIHYVQKFTNGENHVEEYSYKCDKNEFDYDQQNTLTHGITYTIEPSNNLLGILIASQNDMKSQYFNSKARFDTYSIHSETNKTNDDADKIETEDKSEQNRNDFNIVFVSNSQSESSSPLNNLEPITMCETILQENGSVEREFACSFNENQGLNDSLYGNNENFYYANKYYTNNNSQGITKQPDVDINKNVSNHFQTNAALSKPDHVDGSLLILNPTTTENNNLKLVISPVALQNGNEVENNINIENIDCNFKDNNFNFKNRLRFVPKGMSQLFENCRSKTACDYTLDKEYYEDSIYNNFANDVQVNTEIYEPVIQNVEDLTTKDIHKFQNKLKIDNAQLVFDEESLKEAKVLGQVDCKFIVAIMKNQSGKSDETTEYLILFDQHAVHERIRLETNLSDYFTEDRWATVSLDNIVLKLSKDQILYLHNYKDKFYQLGLQWTILNHNEVTINSIPEAILGKNPREVEKVIKAVKNLIVEEINVIKNQKGCVSLYPKSIMDLVFSEACRYAIKFGDALSKSDCIDLINALADCKTPFQCAHGRPVMAVILDVKIHEHEYKVQKSKLTRFKPKKTETAT